MAGVYSTRAAIGTIDAGASSNVFTVPAGYVFVLRCVTAVSVSAASAVFQVAVAATANVISAELGAVGTGLIWDLRVVVNAGEVISVAAATGNLQYSISGYLLYL